jgi:hypothetical protein
MKTKIAIFLLSVAAVVSFSALTTKGNSSKNNEPKSYQSQGGQLMSDKDQFN